MTDKERNAADLLVRARRGWSPSAADQERVRRAIGAASAVATPGSVPTVVPRAAVWGARLLAAATIAVASGGAGYWIGYRAGHRQTPQVAPIAAAPWAPAPTGPPAPRTAQELQPALTLPTPGASHHGGHLTHHDTENPAPGAGESLAVEVRALRNAERALRDGNPGLALAFLEDLDRQVPRGQLTEERDAMATLARCARGDRPLDVDLAGEFVERHPASVYRARVEQTCAATDLPTPGDSARRRLDP
jgi:hypothetical protein